MPQATFTAIVEKEGDGYVALCPELDVASQGDTVEEATSNLKETVELFLETADPAEVERRRHSHVFVELADRLADAKDPAERARLKDELARLTFGN